MTKKEVKQMREKDIIKVQAYEAELYRKLSLIRRCYGIQDEHYRLYRAEWAGVYRTMEVLGIPVDYMKRKAVIEVQKYEAELYRKLTLYRRYHGIQDEQYRLYRAEWAGVYRTMEVLGIPVDYELREGAL